MREVKRPNRQREHDPHARGDSPLINALRGLPDPLMIWVRWGGGASLDVGSFPRLGDLCACGFCAPLRLGRRDLGA